MFGFGFIQNGPPPGVDDAVSVELFLGSESLGALAFDSAPYPTLLGGFAGIGSTTPFDRAIITFRNTTFTSDYAIDNLRFNAVAVSEPASLAMVGFAGLAVSGFLIRRRVAMAH